MLRRVITSLFFLLGGGASWVAASLAKGFGKAQAGMSDGAGHGVSTESPLEALVLFLLCLYFLVSASGALFVTKKSSLWIMAGISHSLLLIAFLALCASGIGDTHDLGDFLGGVVVVFLLGLVALLPWLAAWALTLAKAQNAT